MYFDFHFDFLKALDEEQRPIVGDQPTASSPQRQKQRKQKGKKQARKKHLDTENGKKLLNVMFSCSLTQH